ncbi:MAG: hypothetical protein AVDCRST_MAG73-1394 [uncultured Thermomicrobiales bacterium]|uniref:Uncharacterized protein n=1 Tax=uncultured Thermomicrobiales bacterium TaxID=1645740 RepID=A0A6J4TYQ3_9BACT|nr:MAG: hypothetical protein AVDCRST_MAG73-1394 [uncultured Thermomicrobiales bacterium]
MSPGTDRAPAVRAVIAWWEVADGLEAAGDGALAAAIRSAMEGRRLGDDAAFALTDDERARVAAVLEGGGEGRG